MKKVAFTLLLAAIGFSGFSQSKSDSVSKYRPSFGFNLGVNQSLLFNSNASDELVIENAPGFRLGVISNFPILKRWSVSPKAELSFNYGKIIENNINYRVDPNNLDFMTHFKYKFKVGQGKIKPYCYLGPNLRVPLSGEEFDGITYDTQVSLAGDFAFGLEIDLGYFLLSPEIRLSSGLTDIRENPTGEILRGSNAAFVMNFSGK
jgi:hypothetical protein